MKAKDTDCQSARAIESWLNSLAQMIGKNTKLRFYELPVLSRAYSPLRWWINGGMRAGIVDDKARERTVTVYTNKRDFKKRLEIPNEETIYIFLVSRNGSVLWQEKGRLTEAKLQNLQNTIQEDLPISAC